MPAWAYQYSEIAGAGTTGVLYKNIDEAHTAAYQYNTVLIPNLTLAGTYTVPIRLGDEYAEVDELQGWAYWMNCTGAGNACTLDLQVAGTTRLPSTVDLLTAGNSTVATKRLTGANRIFPKNVNAQIVLTTAGASQAAAVGVQATVKYRYTPYIFVP